MKRTFALFLVLFTVACSQRNIGQQTTSIHFSNTPKQNLTQPYQEQGNSIVKIAPDDYISWISYPSQQQKVQKYKAFLHQHALDNIVPDFELFQTARDWQKCNTPAYEIPPQELWGNIIPTLNILKRLRDDGIINDFTVSSVYRNDHLNRCAGGAGASKHVLNAAMDFRIGPTHPTQLQRQEIEQNKNKLCKFWREKGLMLNMGLGIYASGQIHIDSSGYRHWGADHKQQSSPCNSIT
ncbi:D-Ala-D-Ala carboxypeptidase family metallohydrolase [Acinetobacter rudis]|uniref:D-Ala-D-Ala carboxypeptidase family metallohydrolase n=1 Tax=Acinetobacter rudis TaxID=632955 RepID=UPI00280E3194|nr:D-Ala-D-Ala carboxypeptidase family metallohydrolase [Acinetobacter rudis]MDQ8952201.1 D-Ala-D-Ala carboxypeptidase family metallohydrolase [Acinetobacter rudis]